MKKELIKLANHLDGIGRKEEADFIDNLLKKAQEEVGQKRYGLGYIPFPSEPNFELLAVYDEKSKAEEVKTELENIDDDILLVIEEADYDLNAKDLYRIHFE